MAGNKNGHVTVARDTEILRLHLAGVPPHDIARKVGVSPTSGAVWKSIRRSLAREQAPLVEELRTTELSRLDAMLAGCWDMATAGNLNAIDKVLKIMERRAKYVPGLENPVQIQVEEINEDRETAEELIAQFMARRDKVVDLDKERQRRSG